MIQDKSYAFALRFVKLYQFLVNEKKEFVLSKQVLRSGTSIGGQSGKDFQAKMAIAYKEARETHYWIRLLRDSGYLADNNTETILSDCEEIMKILGSIQKTMKIRNS